LNLKPYPYFSRINQILGERQIEAFLVGGFVRDILIGRPTADIDMAIKADALITAQELAEALGGRYVLLDEANKIARVVFLRQGKALPLSR